MSKFRATGLHPDSQRAKRRQYTRDNRKLWKELGFRMMTALVHDDDRVEILAELEVRRCIKAQEMAENKKSGTATISHLSSRNITPAPTQKEMGEFKRSEELRNCLNADDIEHCVDNAINARKRFDSCVIAEANMEDGEAKWRLFAKQVAYGNLAAAWWRLAQVRFERGDKKSVFMAKVDD